MPDQQIQVSRTVDVAPDQLFALLASPTRHQEFDGADMLRGIDGDAERVQATGDQFTMNMYNDTLGDYRMRNTVVVYEEGRAIGWAPELYPADGYTDKVGDMKIGGHTYTWRLEPTGDGGTAVTQTYAWDGVGDPKFREMFPMLTEQQLSDSVDRAAAAARG